MNPLLDEYLIPPAIRAGLERYLKHGLRPGDCLRAILANDLMQAFARADDGTMRGMAAIVAYIHNEVPGIAHGSYEAVDRWIEMHLEDRKTVASP